MVVCTRYELNGRLYSPSPACRRHSLPCLSALPHIRVLLHFSLFRSPSLGISTIRECPGPWQDYSLPQVLRPIEDIAELHPSCPNFLASLPCIAQPDGNSPILQLRALHSSPEPTTGGASRHLAADDPTGTWRPRASQLRSARFRFSTPVAADVPQVEAHPPSKSKARSEPAESACRVCRSVPAARWVLVGGKVDWSKRSADPKCTAASAFHPYCVLLTPLHPPLIRACKHRIRLQGRGLMAPALASSGCDRLRTSAGVGRSSVLGAGCVTGMGPPPSEWSR